MEVDCAEDGPENAKASADAAAERYSLFTMSPSLVFEFIFVYNER
ncbi:hypothetical protein P775_05660 [Puniceibacterium antarcticum]|uniref:Uncharacterized protein n=1 Tax=Puniceibacterium antarcticum TaxID=1206336 RepID=A0A2G8RI17_9RHOB|nr:hypothetical protein P775_05660 [Puniceibacterium antarcticum]